MHYAGNKLAQIYHREFGIIQNGTVQLESPVTAGIGSSQQRPNNAIMQQNTHRNTQRTCREQQHIYFLKIHKAGSTSIQNLFWRFGVTRKLSMAVFKRSFPYPDVDFQSWLLPDPTMEGFDGSYDIFCEHSIFNPEQLQQNMKEDTKYVANLREPLSRLRSSIKFYGYQTEYNLSDDVDLVEHYLNAQQEGKTEDTVARGSRWTEKGSDLDRVAREFGWTKGSDLDAYVQAISPMFSTVVILERLDESLVLMKRQFCWKFKDILYLPMRKQSYDKVDAEKEKRQREILRKIAGSEFTLYEHFSEKLEKQIVVERNDFDAEVKMFMKVADEAKQFCTNICQKLGQGVRKNVSHEKMMTYLNSVITFNASQWEGAFNVTGLECIMNMFSPNVYRYAQVVTQYPGICQNKVPGVSAQKLYCKEHFAYSFPWELLYEAHKYKPNKTFLFHCY